MYVYTVYYFTVSAFIIGKTMDIIIACHHLYKSVTHNNYHIIFSS